MGPKSNPSPHGSPPPAYLWPAVGVFFWLAALAGALALFSFHPADQPWREGFQGPIHNLLGTPGAWLAGVGLLLCGLAAWWPVLLLVLAGAQLWLERRGEPLVWLAGGAMWLIMGTTTLMGLSGASFYSGRWPLGGPAGRALAQALEGALGSGPAWLVGLVVTLAGLGLVGWSLWPVLAALPRILNLPGLQRRPEPEPEDPAPAREPESEPQGQAEPEPRAAAPEPPPPPEPAAEGPRIKPRARHQISREAGPLASGGDFRLPPLELLQEPQEPQDSEQVDSLKLNSRLLEEKLADFGVKGRVVEVAPGPVVTMYEFKPAPGVKISKVAGLSDDLAMNLKATSIRVVAPIPGKAVIGIEIPNQYRETVFLRELLASPAYRKSSSPLTIAVGKDILGAPVVEDLAKMPHLLIAGATGSGKSVFINSLVLSILYKATPEAVRLVMVDPKRIELSIYNDIPHLLYPIITEPKEATAGLRWAVQEMERRYELLAGMGVRSIDSFNQRLKKSGPPPALAEEYPELGPLPYLVIIIDELADLMMVSSKEVEALITRLAQMARAAGIHLVLATQRPSVDVITGLIKANFPARISFKVTSRVDSRTIMDQQGAEHLLGLGDMLFSRPGTMGLVRLHGAYVSEAESAEVAEFLRGQAQPQYDESVVQGVEEGAGGLNGGDEVDEHYAEAVALVKQTGQASISGLQRRLRVGYNRAARMIEQMERDGIVGPSDGSKPRQVLIRD